jgi:hypothetical protein
MKMTFIDVTALTAGQQIAGAEVAAVRTSKSGKTVFITARRSDGSEYEFPQQASTRIAVVVPDDETVDEDDVPFDHSDCPPQAHIRSAEGTDPGEQPVDADGNLACNDCGESMFYCETTGRYHHVDPAAPACFLIHY